MYDKLGIHFIVPVWGESYTELFLKFCLPSLLASKNLPFLDNKNNIFTICTEEAQSETIIENKYYKKLTELMEVNLEFIDDILLQEEAYSSEFRCQNHFKKMTKAHNRAIKLSKDREIIYSFIMPDNIFYDGSISNVVKLIDDSTQVVYAYGLHINEEELYESLEQLDVIDEGIINIDGFSLASLSSKRLHIASSKSLIDSKPFLPNGNLFLKEKNQMLLKLCYLHPFLVLPKKKGMFIPPDSTFDDGDYVNKSSTKNKQKKILDSRVFFMYSIDSKENKKDLSKYYVSMFNIFEQASRIKNIDVQYQDNLDSTCILYFNEEKLNEKTLEEFNSLGMMLLFLIKNSDYIPNIQDLKVQIITSNNPFTTYLDILQNFIKILKKIVKSDMDKNIKIYYENVLYSFEQLKENSSIESNPFKVLKLIENLFDILNFNQETNIFQIKELQEKIKKVETILVKHTKVSLYAAGDDTLILCSLLSSLKGIETIYDENIEKVGTKIKGIKVQPFIEEKIKNEVIIISSSLHEDKIYEKLVKYDGLTLYKLNKI
ncbi:MAG: hypothetical protein ACNI25_16415 [Halarcobacter sp.]